jgi:hypothetical protein
MEKRHAPDLDLKGLGSFINGLETPTLEFLKLTRDNPKNSSDNIFTFSEGGDPVSRNSITIVQLDPDFDANQAANFVDQQMNLGFEPICFADVNIPGGTISVIAFREPGGHGKPDSGGFTFTKASLFGLNMDGSIDTEDNGVGSRALGSINTRDPHLIGAAIPQSIALIKFGTFSAVRGHKVEVTNLANNLTIIAAIVDFGPSEKRGGPVSKGVALDLTLAAQKALGGNGMINVKYRFV